MQHIPLDFTWFIPGYLDEMKRIGWLVDPFFVFALWAFIDLKSKIKVNHLLMLLTILDNVKNSL